MCKKYIHCDHTDWSKAAQDSAASPVDGAVGGKKRSVQDYRGIMPLWIGDQWRRVRN